MNIERQAIDVLTLVEDHTRPIIKDVSVTDNLLLGEFYDSNDKVKTANDFLILIDDVNIGIPVSASDILTLNENIQYFNVQSCHDTLSISDGVTYLKIQKAKEIMALSDYAYRNIISNIGVVDSLFFNDSALWSIKEKITNNASGFIVKNFEKREYDGLYISEKTSEDEVMYAKLGEPSKVLLRTGGNWNIIEREVSYTLIGFSATGYNIDGDYYADGDWTVHFNGDIMLAKASTRWEIRHKDGTLLFHSDTTTIPWRGNTTEAYNWYSDVSGGVVGVTERRDIFTKNGSAMPTSNDTWEIPTFEIGISISPPYFIYTLTPTIIGLNYTLEGASTLAGPWTPIETKTATSNTMTFNIHVDDAPAYARGSARYGNAEETGQSEKI